MSTASSRRCCPTCRPARCWTTVSRMHWTRRSHRAPLGQQLLSFRLWRRDGTILYSSVKGQTGKRFEPSRNLKAAFDGLLVAEFDRVDDPESEKERESGKPLLEIYNPVRQPWSGVVVAVSEFYEIAPDLARDLRQAAIRS